MARFFSDPLQSGHSEHNLEEALQDSLETPSLAEVLFYDSFDEERGLFRNRSSVGFAFEIVPLVGGDSRTLMEEMRALASDSLPLGGFLQTLLWADHRVGPFLEHWESSIRREEARKVAKNRSEFLVRERDPKTFRVIVSFSVPLSSPGSVLNELEKTRDLLEQTFKVMSSVHRVGAADLVSLVKAMMSLPSGIEALPSRYRPYESLSEQLSSGNWIEVEDDCLRFGRDGFDDRLFQSFSVTDWPEEWHPLMVSELTGSTDKDNQRIDCPFFVSHTLHICNQTKEDVSYATRAHLVEKQGAIPFLRRQSPSLAEEFDECGRVRVLRAKGDRWIRTSLMVGVWSSVEEQEGVESRLRQIYRSLGLRVSSNRWFHFPTFLASLPMGWGEYGEELVRARLTNKTISSEAGGFMPVQAEWQGVGEHGMLLQGRKGQLLSWDPFGNEVGNYNTVVVGTSGSGKSVFLQDLLYNGYSRGRRVFIIEVGRSFLRLCNLLDGTHIAFNGSEICLNPWPLVVRSNLKETMLSLVESVIATMCLSKRAPTDWEMAKISSCVQEVWSDKGDSASIDDVRIWLRENGAEEFSETIAVYCTNGKYGSYFSGDRTTDLSNPMVVIELEELADKPQLRSVALQICMATIANEVFLGDRKQKCYICVDEAWDLLRDGQTGPFIEKLARRLRKYGGALVIGTQGVGDFSDNPGAEAAYNNSAWKCFLLQDESEIAALPSKKGINEGIVRAISSIKRNPKGYREIVILGSDGGYSINRLSLDPFSRLLFSTQARDFGDIEIYRKRGLSTEESIESVLRDRAC